MSYAPQATPTEGAACEDLQLASRNYWAGRTGREDPPAPTYRMVEGKMTLGRYMDPFGCEAHMRTQQMGWQKWMLGFMVTAGVTVAFAEIDWFLILVAAPLYALWYFGVKAKRRAKYERYEAIRQQIIDTGEPQWVAYDKATLQEMDKFPPQVSP